MTATARHSEDISLFNDYVQSVKTDASAMRRLIFRLRPLVKKSPTNSMLRIALAGSLLHSGEVEAGEVELQAAYGLRAGAQYAEVVAMAILHSQTGLWGKASILYDELLSGRCDAAAVDNACNHGMVAGNLPLVYRALEKARNCGYELNEVVVHALDILERFHLQETFAGHQGVVAAHLAGRQVYYGWGVIDEEGEEPFITFNHYVTGDRRSRTELNRSLFDSLCDYYEGLGGVCTGFVGVIQHDLMPIEGVC